ncbi:hypothetical protein Tco_1061161, partial [Tanacetum coccineum]
MGLGQWMVREDGDVSFIVNLEMGVVDRSYDLILDVVVVAVVEVEEGEEE